VGDILICPKCRERLWVGEMQIPLVTCPRCLSRVINPNAAREPIEVEPISQNRRPRRVIPLENETGIDLRETTHWLGVLAAGLFIGAILIANWLGMNIMTVALLVGAIVLTGAIPVIHRKSRRINEPAPQYLQRVERGGTTVFDYASPRQSDGSSFAGGFGLAIGLSFITMVLMGIARGAGRVLPVGVGIAGIGVLIYFTVRAARDPQGTGFLQGLVVGTVLGSLSCGPCALAALTA